MLRFFFISIIFFQSFLALADLPDFVSLNKKVSPAVVNISTTQSPKINPNDPMIDFLERFYGVQPRTQPIQSLGSGFLINKDGLIITNNHVVAKADEIEVQLLDSEKKYKAKVVGKDPKTDIALIKINAGKDLPFLELGSSDNLEIGAWVAAIGNPLGFSHSITQGIISGKGRDVGELGIFPFIQTDASINPGNSGGPLVNLNGEVIGVNTFIIGGGAQGLGFAVPIDGVKQILPELEKKGKVTRGYLGITYTPVDPRVAQHLGLDEAKGAIVGDVVSKSPAQEAGLQTYDVILEFGKTEIDSGTSLANAVAKQKIGSTVDVKVWRDGKERKLKVKIESPPDEFSFQSRKDLGEKAKKGVEKGIEAPFNLGFRYAAMTRELSQALDIPYIKKPVILSIDSRSPASQAGLSRGDIILDINRKPVRSLNDVKERLKRGSNLIRVQRGEYRVALFIEG